MSRERQVVASAVADALISSYPIIKNRAARLQWRNTARKIRLNLNGILNLDLDESLLWQEVERLREGS
jgi:hypothetical protein